MKVKLFFVSMLTVFLSMTISGALGAEPKDLIVKTNNDLTKITSKKKVNLEKIIAVLEKSTDFKSLSNGVLNKYCKKLTPEQCKELKSVFEELLKYSTSSKLSKYEAEKTDYLDETVKGSKAVVKTKVRADKRTVKINYELKKIGGKWKISNYIVDDVDTIKNYKKQFRKLFRKKTYEEIVSKLRKKIKKYKK